MDALSLLLKVEPANCLWNSTFRSSLTLFGLFCYSLVKRDTGGANNQVSENFSSFFRSRSRSFAIPPSSLQKSLSRVPDKSSSYGLSQSSILSGASCWDSHSTLAVVTLQTQIHFCCWHRSPFGFYSTAYSLLQPHIAHQRTSAPQHQKHLVTSTSRARGGRPPGPGRA